MNPNPCATYAEWYSNTTVGRSVPPDLLQARFDVGAGAAANQQPNAMCAFIDNHLQYKIVLLTVDDANVVHVLHRCSTFHNDVDATAFDNLVFASIGDILPGGTIPTVRPPNNWLHQARTGNDIAVPTVAAVDTALAADADPQFLFDPRQAGDADTETVRVRNSAPLPAAYAHLVLGRSLTARQLWELLLPAIRNDNNLPQCDLLIRWLRAALTRVDAQPNPVVSVALATPTAVLLDAPLAEVRAALLDQDLPNRVGGPSTMAAALNTGIGGVVTGIDNMRQDQVNQNRTILANKRAAESPDAYYGLILVQLMRTCHVASSHTTITCSTITYPTY